VNRECLGRLHAALAVDVGHIGQQCEFFFRQARTGFAQLIDRSRETLRHRLVEILQRRSLHDTDAKACELHRLERRKVFCGHDSIGLGASLYRPRNRAD